MDRPLEIGIFIFDEVEVLDFAGPFEVFSLAKKSDNPLCHVRTVAATLKTIHARNGLKVSPDNTFSDHPIFDVLIIPGGYGARELEIKKPDTLHWIKNQKPKVPIMASVCTGSLLLAECGLLDGRKATTHWMRLDRLENEYPKVEVIRGVKFVDDGDIITSAGISAGINMSFHLLTRLFHRDIAKSVARDMEYDIEL